MSETSETGKPEVDHPQAHPAVKKQRSAMPALAAEIVAAITTGWFTYMGTGDWKMGVGAALAMLSGGLVHRGGVWYTARR